MWPKRKGTAPHDQALQTDRPSWFGEDPATSWPEAGLLERVRARVLGASRCLPSRQRKVVLTDFDGMDDGEMERNVPVAATTEQMGESRRIEAQWKGLAHIVRRKATKMKMTTILGITAAYLLLSGSAGADESLGVPTETVREAAADVEFVDDSESSLPAECARTAWRQIAGRQVLGRLFSGTCIRISFKNLGCLWCTCHYMAFFNGRNWTWSDGHTDCGPDLPIGISV